ncbi:unnamed protein product [Moneuplotes crassus]|uniref:Uncharacterized protein n=2 Tax=Euplotes crassus TaxID=5936 RepID=A0AAD1XB33_EUPCR|nr:unnamed protein product [Moneuplotes crassus]
MEASAEVTTRKDSDRRAHAEEVAYTHNPATPNLPIQENQNSRNHAPIKPKANTSILNRNKMKIPAGKIAMQTLHRRRKSKNLFKKEFKLKKELLKNFNAVVGGCKRKKASGRDRQGARKSDLKHNRSVTEMNQSSNIRLYRKTNSRFSSLHQSINETYSNRNFKKSGSGVFAHPSAGPGSYNLPGLLGSISMDANKKNHPAYSIGTQSKKKLLILCKDQAHAVKGQSSPGVGKYSGDINKIKERSPNATIGREHRFLSDKDRSKLNNSVHCYDSPDRDSIKINGNKTNGFTKETRFLEMNRSLNEKKNMPSSQSYNHSHYGSIKERSEKIVPHSRNENTNQSLDKFAIKTYFKELERGYCNKEGPGPAAYSTGARNTLSNFRKSFDGSFTKAKRNISRYRSKRSPGPSDYDTKTAYKNLNSIVGAGTIGKSRRNIDVTLMTSLHAKDFFKKY